MTIDQCKARILAVLSDLSVPTYWNLQKQVTPIYTPIFSVALKELIMEGLITREPHIKITHNQYALILYRLVY